MSNLLRKPRAPDFALLALLAVAWGSAYVSVKFALPTLPAISITTGRAVFGVAFLLALMRYTGDRLPRGGWQVWRLIALNGLLMGVIPFALISWAALRIGSGLISILVGTQPLWSMLIAHFAMADEKLNGRRVVGMVLGFLGIVWLIGFDAFAGLGDDLLAQLAVLGAAASWGTAHVLARGLPMTSSPLSRGAAVMLAGLALLVPLCLVIDRPWTLRPDGAAIGGIATLGIFSTALGMVMLMRLVGTVGVGFAAWSNFLSPVVGVGLGALLLAEVVPPRALGALALVVLGVAISYWRPKPAPTNT
jgi:drug/metabolite transporter (DMT)-like permease